MIFLRILAAISPQILLFLFIGARLDLLGGWNHTSGSTDVLVKLFLWNPAVTATLLVAEIVRYRRRWKSGEGGRSLWLPAFALLLFVEALAIDVFMLSQLRMH